MKVTEVALIAKQRYCEIKRSCWLGLVYKVQARESLTDTEHSTWQQLEREILNIVNQKASLVSGLTHNNRNSARFSYMGCIYIVKVDGNVGKIINVQREI